MNLKAYQPKVSRGRFYINKKSSEVLKFPLQEEEVEVRVLISMKENFFNINFGIDKLK